MPSVRTTEVPDIRDFSFTQGSEHVTSPIYEWSGDYFCAGCIVHTITEHEPFSFWLEIDGNAIANQSTDSTLRMIRRFLTQRSATFPNAMPTMPHKLRQPPEGVQVCATCLNFFTIPTSEEQHD